MGGKIAFLGIPNKGEQNQNWSPAKGDKIRIGCLTPAFLGAQKRAELLRHLCILGGPQTKGDKIRGGCLTPALSGAQKRAEMLHHPCILGGPQTRGHNQKSKHTLGATMMPLVSQSMGAHCAVRAHCAKCAPSRCPCTQGVSLPATSLLNRGLQAKGSASTLDVTPKILTKNAQREGMLVDSPCGPTIEALQSAPQVPSHPSPNPPTQC